jgi:hypothetical protein
MSRHVVRLGGLYLVSELAWGLAAVGAYAMGFHIPGF